MSSKNKNKKTVVITGSAGFIGFHLSKKLLNNNWRVIGIDSMSNYYDVNLKIKRENILLENNNFVPIHSNIEKPNFLLSVFEKEKPDVVIHLAAQAGVRYSIDNPRVYLETNINGTFELLEACRSYPPKHILIASTSSVYGFSENLPFEEIQKADFQMSFYAASKKSTENMAHSYSHIHKLPITIFRFFTVYGPWGRPDMALFKFTKCILNNKPIEVYNNGNMRRDFTYIDDLIKSITLLIDKIPSNSLVEDPKIDSISPIAPYRIVNIGNSVSVPLHDFIIAIEKALDKSAKINMLPIQPGDVPETLASNKLLRKLTNFTPDTDINYGVSKFVDWYKKHYYKNEAV